jgi:hypothetical protein
MKITAERETALTSITQMVSSLSKMEKKFNKLGLMRIEDQELKIIIAYGEKISKMISSKKDKLNDYEKIIGILYGLLCRSYQLRLIKSLPYIGL